ncbi:CRISPR-associated helicase Cas3' [Azospirillum sp. SYSU D00513]|uniref:CRISPR-associated helicase Cas3' n=1 Tax=Azospirillum sp. SYSU D00513 TaxID=2812561 RepID=UPI001A97CD08|nr:CRISPR-associated helicase Cas3' [Azospirillum sp. SYSU D00513]
MPPLYAHSGNSGDGSDWEPLIRHLLGVAERAAGFAAILKMESAAWVMGALHDAGKTNPAYQRYIKGDGPSPDHSTAGACIAANLYGDKWGRILAFAIAGHHAGLTNGEGDGPLTPLVERLRRFKGDTTPPAGVTLPDLKGMKPPIKLSARDGFKSALLIRMLFSTLIDADRLATEEFYAGLNGKPVERGYDKLSLEQLRDRLMAHLDGVAAKAAEDVKRDPALGPVTKVRKEVLDHLLKQAGEEPGLFSLTVPTGGGKTLASLAFALNHAVRHEKRRVIYVIPFTSIIEQTADVFRKALGDEDAVLEHHSGFDPERDTDGKDKGTDDEDRDGGRKARLAAENWDRPVVVTTAVQFFESLFSNRPGRCRKLHNIAGSVIVLDEAQTLPRPFLRPCLKAIEALKRDYGCTLVLCTATQPALRKEDGFEDGLEDVRELAPDPECLQQQLKRVRVEMMPGQPKVEMLAEAMTDVTQSMTIVNSRRHALDLFAALRKEEVEGARLLTTGLCAAHRRTVLAAVREDLRNGLPVRLVATSLVEAGVDISFPLVLRAMAGLDSVAQAAGRCNRDGALGPEGGTLLLFDPAENPDHKPPPELEQLAATAKTLVERANDPLGLEAIRASFQEVYWAQELHGKLDAKGILAELDARADTLLFPFATIAEQFRLIEDRQAPVIIPYEPAKAKIEGLLRDLEFVPSPGAVARKLQPFIVQIPRSARAALVEAQAAELVQPKKFGDQFVKLVNEDLYDRQAGLRWDDPTYRSIERDIL